MSENPAENRATGRRRWLVAGVAGGAAGRRRLGLVAQQCRPWPNAAAEQAVGLAVANARWQPLAMQQFAGKGLCW
jgi:hypothetical protein